MDTTAAGSGRTSPELRAAGRDRRRRPGECGTRSGRRVPRPLLVLLLAGAAIRALTMAFFAPTHYHWIDAPRFVRLDPRGLFDDFWMPAGYPVFLKAVRVVSDNLAVTIGAQHLLGLATAALLYLAVRRVTGPTGRGLALVPAGAVLLGGDFVYLEHLLMNEALFLALLSGALWATVASIDEPTPLPHLAIAGVLLASCVLTRGSAVMLVPVVALWLVVALGDNRRRLLGLATFGVAGAVVVGSYLAVASSGAYAGIADMNGWHHYGRVAPFADCARFTPPAGTEVLCEQVPQAARPGPFFYVWSEGSPGRRAFPLSPTGAMRVGSFARAAMAAQPGDYAAAVITDLYRYVDSEVGRDLWAGNGPGLFTFALHDPALERVLANQLSGLYTGTEPRNDAGREPLASYQRVSRLSGMVVVALGLATVGGVILGRGRARMGALLFGACAVTLFAAPVVILSWDIRYGIPPTALLVVAGTLGAAAAQEALARRRPLPSDSAAEPPPAPPSGVGGGVGAGGLLPDGRRPARTLERMMRRTPA